MPPKSAAPSLEALATRLLPTIADPSASTLFVSISLWGNRMDLSLWPADAGVASSADAFNQVLASSNEQLLADDTEDVLALLDGLRSTTGEGDEVIIDLVVDNGEATSQTSAGHAAAHSFFANSVTPILNSTSPPAARPPLAVQPALSSAQICCSPIISSRPAARTLSRCG